ncbi:chromosomal replication initiator DnaA [Rhodovulum sp. DZ06]|uniref:chromosomal replication initiator DnaA n=1 Tax=Rhodovulum sp. DZ06 TaxID=3425126 RepID=UPI003D340EB0
MRGASQIPIPLHLGAARGRDSFQVSSCNEDALEVVDNWREWPRLRMALSGPPGSGKSHLLEIWASETGAARLRGRDLAAADLPALASIGAVAVDDADAVVAEGPEAETALFHLYNLMEQEGGALLLAAREAPARWGARLPDLASRLAAMPLARLERPDEALIRWASLKLFADRQLSAPPAAVLALAELAGADLAALERAVARIDAAALASRRKVSAALVREVLSDPAAERDETVTGMK